MTERDLLVTSMASDHCSSFIWYEIRLLQIEIVSVVTSLRVSVDSKTSLTIVSVAVDVVVDVVVEVVVVVVEVMIASTV